MKTRLGFVSNSSSSSFVAVGLKIDKDIVTDEFIERHDEYHLFYDVETGYDNNKFAVIGTMLACGDEYDFNTNEYSMRDIQSISSKLIDNIGDIGNVVIITGTMMT